MSMKQVKAKDGERQRQTIGMASGKRDEKGMNAPSLTRREVGQMAAALVIGFALAPSATWGEEARLPGSLDKNRALDAWLRINADGSAVILTGKVELGQGIVTALAQIAAEELDLPLARIEMISGDTARTPNEGYTSGSQ